MAISVTFSLDRLCSGGGHADVHAVIDGEAKTFRDMDTATLRTPLDRIEKEKLAELLIRAKLAGLTPVQARNVMQNGFAVSIS